MWIYSKALMEAYENSTCSPEQEAAFSQANCSATDASAPLSGSHTPKPCLWHDRTMEPSRLSRFGQTCRPFTADLGADLLTWWREDFLARTSALQEPEPDSTASGQECGITWRESLGKYDPASHSLKTAQLSLLEDLTGCCVTLPRWGLMRDGVLYPQPTVALHTSENESGSWRTPCAQDGGARGEYKCRTKLDEYLAKGHTLGLAEQVKWPHLWPTPTVCGNHNRKGSSKTSGDGLATAVKRWPTPTAHMAKETNAPSEALRNEPSLSSLVGGRLNPTWVEMLMGWPKGWTSLEPMNHIEYKKWLMGFACYAKCKNSRSQVVQSLWENFGKEAFQRASRGLSDIPEAEALLTEMRKHSDGIDAAWIQLASQETPEDRLRSVRLQREIASASRGSGYNEQHGSEYTDAMQTLSRLLAHYGQACWQDGSWENAVPRVVNGMAYRTHRLKAIGNGQVSRVAAAAFHILTGGDL